jgi:predicted enzyme related to lactoylglutathione lyase
MSDLNAAQNRVVWFDIPVADLERAAAFYRGVLGITVHVEKTPGSSFGVLQHDQGNGGCLVPKQGEISSSAGVLVYLNANGRLREALRQVEALGGRVVEAAHALGPHGFRAIVIDSEGNRIALHAGTDS